MMEQENGLTLYKKEKLKKMVELVRKEGAKQHIEEPYQVRKSLPHNHSQQLDFNLLNMAASEDLQGESMSTVAKPAKVFLKQKELSHRLFDKELCRNIPEPHFKQLVPSQVTRNQIVAELKKLPPSEQLHNSELDQTLKISSKEILERFRDGQLTFQHFTNRALSNAYIE